MIIPGEETRFYMNASSDEIDPTNGTFNPTERVFTV